jgi:GNAT superfamily N-acetyltransferase
VKAPSEIRIRPAEPGEAATVAKILHDSFAEYESLYTREGFAATTPDEDQVWVRMREGPVWLASRESTALGTVAAVIKGQSAYMRGMAVLPAARGLAVGAQLVEQVEGWALSQGCCRVSLSTTPFLAAAIRLYERFGFRRTSEGPNELFGTPLFTMQKELSRG